MSEKDYVTIEGEDEVTTPDVESDVIEEAVDEMAEDGTGTAEKVEDAEETDEVDGTEKDDADSADGTGEEAVGDDADEADDEAAEAVEDAAESLTENAEDVDELADGAADASDDEAADGTEQEVADEAAEAPVVADDAAEDDDKPVEEAVAEQPKETPAATEEYVEPNMTYLTSSISPQSEDSSTSKIPEFVKFPVAVIIALACAAGGFLIGHVTGNPMAAAPNTVKTELTTDELGTVVGRVTYAGQTFDITAKEVLMLNDTIAGDQHNYPTADMVMATARNKILLQDAEARGIAITDEALADFAKEMLGSDDYDTIASEYQIDAESLKELIKSSYVSKEIRKQVVGENEPTLASPPATPEEGQESTASKEYYDYIIDAAGDEWDSTSMGWVDEQGDFARVLSASTTFDPKAQTASYDDALGAYQVLGSRYSAAAATYDTLWSDYMKGLLSQSSITIYSLMS